MPGEFSSTFGDRSPCRSSGGVPRPSPCPLPGEPDASADPEEDGEPLGPCPPVPTGTVASRPWSGASSARVQATVSEPGSVAAASSVAAGAAAPSDRSIARSPAENVRSPSLRPATEGTSPVETSVSGPDSGSATGSALPRQVAVAVAVFWATPTVSRVAGRTSAAPRAVRSATASAGSSTVVVTSVGANASPAAARSGKSAAIRTVAGSRPEGSVQT